jgi:putative hydrolase of the HAD superfamily
MKTPNWRRQGQVRPRIVLGSTDELPLKLLDMHESPLKGAIRRGTLTEPEPAFPPPSLYAMSLYEKRPNASTRGVFRVIRTFLFDMGNVLVHFSHDRMCAQIGALCGRTGGDIRNLLLDSGLQWEFERGRVSVEDFCLGLGKAAGFSFDLEALKFAGSDIFHLNEPMLPILDALRARGHRLVLLSNTSIAHFEFVQREYDVLERFDDFVLSYRVGALKPDEAIYRAALEAIHCPPGECFYTDDIAAYVEAARGYGLQAEVFTDATTLRDQLSRRGIVLET